MCLSEQKPGAANKYTWNNQDTNNVLGIYSTGAHQEPSNRVPTFLLKRVWPSHQLSTLYMQTHSHGKDKDTSSRTKHKTKSITLNEAKYKKRSSSPTASLPYLLPSKSELLPPTSTTRIKKSTIKNKNTKSKVRPSQNPKSTIQMQIRQPRLRYIQNQIQA